MRAWLFVIAVLATLQLIIQVASTEELSSSTSIDNKSYKMSENIINSSSKTKTTSHSNSNDNNNNNNKVNNQNSHSNSKNNLINNNNKIDNSLDSENPSFSKTTEKPDPATLIEIEKNLLSIFGFKKRPIIDRSKIIIPEAMRKLYADIMGHELNTVNLPKPGLHTKSANTVRSFNHEESKIDARFLHHHRFRLFFNVSSIPKNEKLKAAELNLSRNPIETKRTMRHQVLVYDILRPGIKNKREPIFLLIDSKQIKINESDTISLDVLPAVDRWLREPKKNYGILIHICSGREINNDVPEHRHVRLKRSLDEDNDVWMNHQPLLLTYTDDGRYKPRNIRDTLNHNNHHHNNNSSNSKTHNHHHNHHNNANRPRRASKKFRRKEICQRRPLYVDFQDVGWSDWIVAPPGYEAYYCQGDCSFPLADHLNSTNHAVVQTLVNSINPTMAPKACCVPTHLTSMTMLYLNDINKVVLKNYPEMAVVGCGCR